MKCEGVQSRIGSKTHLKLRCARVWWEAGGLSGCPADGSDDEMLVDESEMKSLISTR